MKAGTRNPITIPPGVNKDDNPYTSMQWSDADKIRFYHGYPQKIGGWQDVMFNNQQTLQGALRSIWAFQDPSGVEHILLGTNSNLYSYESAQLFNITPLQTTTTNVPNSLGTLYETLNSNPIATTSTSFNIVVTFAPFDNNTFQVNDWVEITGVGTSIGGIAAANLNGIWQITAVSATTFTFVTNSSTAATSTTTGGSTTVVVSTRLVSVAFTAHGFVNGDMISVANATGFAGFLSTDVNWNNVVRLATTNTFNYYLTQADFSGSFATSAVSNSGGSAITITGPTNISIANSLATNYVTLGTDPISVQINSNIVTLTYSPLTEGLIQMGDTIKISGVSGSVGGISAGDLEGEVSVNTVNATTLTYLANGTASSTVSGGGSGVIVSTLVITVSQTANGYSNGQRVGIKGATGFAGLSAAELNVESIVRNAATNSYSIYLSNSTDFPTSSTSSQGGNGVRVVGQIAAGNCDFSTGLGFGGGNFGESSYGIGYPFTDGPSYPRIWFFDRYGAFAVMTPGGQTPLYYWDGNIDIAPVTVPNSPVAVNGVFTARGQIVTWGANGVLNSVQTSDTNNLSNWSIGPTSNAFYQVIETATVLIGSAFMNNQYMLFSQHTAHVMNYVGLPIIWDITDVLLSDGLYAPKAVISMTDSIVWLGFNNLYVYNGSVITPIPNNTLKQWFFSNVNTGKYYKTFMYRNQLYNELWVFAPMFGANEPSNYFIYNWEEGHFTNGTLTRCAAEVPTNLNRPQYLSQCSCDGSITTVLIQQEIPQNYSDNGGNMTGSLSTNDSMIVNISPNFAVSQGGQNMQEISRVIPSNQLLPYNFPDSNQLLYTMTILTKEYDGQVIPRTFGPYNVMSDTQKIDARANGRQRQYVFNFSNTYGFRMQKYFEEISISTRR